MAQQPVCQVFEIVQTLAKVGVTSLTQARAVLGANSFHCGFGREAISHCVFKAAVPAAVVGKHAIGVEHLVGCIDKAVLAVQHVIKLSLQSRDRCF